MSRDEPERPDAERGVERTVPSSIAEEEAVERKDEAEDSRYVMEHYPELAERYPFSWVALAGGVVVGQGVTPQAAEEDARDRHPERVAEHPVHVYFIERAADHLIEH